MIFLWTCAQFHPAFFKVSASPGTSDFLVMCLEILLGVMFACVGSTYVDLQAHSSLAGTSVCANPVLQSPALVVHTHPNSTVLLDVLKPALNFQYGGFHSLQSEKFAQRSVKAPKISVHSCFCFKLPIGLWRNTSSLRQLFILEEILAYSQQEVYGFSGKRMLACWLASLQFGKWPVTITAVWTNRR